MIKARWTVLYTIACLFVSFHSYARTQSEKLEMHFLEKTVLENEAYCVKIKLSVSEDGSINRSSLSNATFGFASRFSKENCDGGRYFYLDDDDVESVSAAIVWLFKGLRRDASLLSNDNLKDDTFRCLTSGTKIWIKDGSSYDLAPDPEQVILTIAGCNEIVEAKILVSEFGMKNSIHLSYKIPVLMELDTLGTSE